MLYHLSLDRIKGGILYPRVPESRMEGEDSILKRVCFAERLAGCLTAMPDGINIAKNLIALEERVGIPAIFHLYLTDEQKIKKENILPNEILAEKGFVPDARYTGEVWVVNQDVKCEHEIIKLRGFKTGQIQYGGQKFLFVTECDIEPSFEIYDREYEFKFTNLRDFVKFKTYISKRPFKVLGEQCSPTRNFFKINVKVPAYTDAGGLWEKVWSLFWNRFCQRCEEEMETKNISKRLVFSNLKIWDL